MVTSKVKVPVVSGMSKNQIERRALSLLKSYCPENLLVAKPTPVLEIFEDFVYGRYGFTPLIQDLPAGLEGRTNITTRTVELDSATHQALEENNVRARFSTAHEIGHVDLHREEKAFSGILTSKDVTYARRKDIPAYLDPEWQANTFSGALLMPLPVVKNLMKNYSGLELLEIMTEKFCVSWEAAKIRTSKI